MKITVMGSGAWGTALALVLVDNGHDVTLWTYKTQQAEEMCAQRVNHRLKGIELPPQLGISDDLSTIAQSEMIVMATPSFAVRDTARMIAPLVRDDVIIVTVSKGVERDSALSMSQVAEQELDGKGRFVALSGPSHAEEVALRVPTGCVAASRDQSAALAAQDAFMNHNFRVYTSEDIVGVELGAALKNILALSCGISDGLGLGDNTKALLMTRGMTEMARLGMAMGGRKETFAGLSGMGDLIVTCTSVHSRNRQCGVLIGKGASVQEAIAGVGATVEGYYAAFSARQLAQKMGVEMPICECAYQILYENQSVKSVVEQLMKRGKRREEDESWI